MKNLGYILLGVGGVLLYQRLKERGDIKPVKEAEGLEKAANKLLDKLIDVFNKEETPENAKEAVEIQRRMNDIGYGYARTEGGLHLVKKSNGSAYEFCNASGRILSERRFRRSGVLGAELPDGTPCTINGRAGTIKGGRCYAEVGSSSQTPTSQPLATTFSNQGFRSRAASF